MSFSIKFINSKVPTEDNKICYGRIIIGPFKETFECNLTFWKKADYQLHWKRALTRLLETNKSCLITSMYDPRQANFIIWWPLYRRNEIVLVHNQLLFMKQLKKPFDVTNPYASIPRYRRFSEDGEELSEWRISIDSIIEFLKK